MKLGAPPLSAGRLVNPGKHLIEARRGSDQARTELTVLGSREARDAWCERVSRLDIDLLCPQHGAIYRGADVKRFISWFAELEVGVLRAGA